MKPADAVNQLGHQVHYLIDHARTSHPLTPVAYTPAAFGESYNALYLRDFTYMGQGAPEFIPLDDMRNILDLFVSRISADGLCPERITNDGKVIYTCHGPHPAADCSMFLVKLANAYRNAGGELTYIESILPKLCAVMEAVRRDAASGLVWIDPTAPSTAYGFTDTIAITGKHLFCSLLLYESFEIVGSVARELRREDLAGRYRSQSEVIAKNLDDLWSVNDQLFFAGSNDCRQPDVWGSAYACTIGILSDDRKKQVARSLWDKKDLFLYRSQVRHVLAPDHWQRLIVNEDWTAPGRFQNGAYWATATGWVAEAFELAQPNAGLSLLCDLVADFENNGVWECIAPDSYHRTANNVSSAALPYASLKKLRP